MRVKYMVFLIFSVYLPIFAMFIPDEFFNNFTKIKKLQKLQAIVSLKKNSIANAILDEILLPGDFPTSFIDHKAATTIKNKGKWIIQETKKFMQEKKQDINLFFESLFTFKEYSKKRQHKLIKLRNHKPIIKDKAILKISNQEPFCAWDSIKKNKNTIMVAAAATTALFLLILKKIQSEKTDEELLEEFNNKIHSKQISKRARIELKEQVMYRLVNPHKDIPLPLLRSVLDKSDKDSLLVNGALTKNHQGYCKFAIYIKDEDLLESTNDLNENVIGFVFKRALAKLDVKILKILLSHDVYLKHITHVLSTLLESEQNEKFFKFIFQHIKNKQSIDKTLSVIEQSPHVPLHKYIDLQKFSLELGGKPNCKTIFLMLLNNEYPEKFGLEKYQSLVSLADFIESRVNGAKLLLQYGAEINDTDNEIVKDKENIFKAIPDFRFRHVSPKEAKDSIIEAVDTIRKNIELEKKFRDQFFNYSHEKNYQSLLKILYRDYPRPAWWILRTLNQRGYEMAVEDISEQIWRRQLKQTIDGREVDSNWKPNYDIALTDMSHIPQFCFEQINIILSSNMSDEETKHEMRSWNDLMLFLFSNTPHIFQKKRVTLETSDQIEYTVNYVDTTKEIDKFLIKIVLQGFYEKPKTYQLLRPLLKYCIESKKLTTDISTQYGNDGSIIHVFARNPFDMPMIELIFETYQNKNPSILYVACSELKETELSNEFSSPIDIVKAMFTDLQKKRSYQKMLNMLENTKQKIVAHCPYVDTPVHIITDQKKSIQWQLNHHPTI